MMNLNKIVCVINDKEEERSEYAESWWKKKDQKEANDAVESLLNNVNIPFFYYEKFKIFDDDIKKYMEITFPLNVKLYELPCISFLVKVVYTLDDVKDFGGWMEKIVQFKLTETFFQNTTSFLDVHEYGYNMNLPINNKGSILFMFTCNTCTQT